ncbi:MAG: hypothetical protein M3328_04745 [Chloroflexota bacterium]|nr:hypothetical protein [Chloroflexota bacterium]
MPDRTLRPTQKALRDAGLLPSSRPRHHVARGASLPPQPGLVARVFGSALVVGGKTLVPVSAVRYVGAGPRSTAHAPTATLTRARQELVGVAVIEVAGRSVRVRHAPTPVRVSLLVLFLAAWDLYWVLRTLRAWLARQDSR